MHVTKIHQIFSRLKFLYSMLNIELTYASPFELLVAIILSAQSTDKKVNEATSKLFPIANTPRALLEMGEVNLKGYIKMIGLHNTKAANIIKTCSLLLEHHGGEVPHDRIALEELPGVGRKTASVILNVVFGELTIAVDTHVFRVSNRIGIARGKKVRDIEECLSKITPVEFKRDAHHWLVMHGRHVCQARQARCSNCQIQDLCEYPVNLV
jgi:endonuclease-3